MYTIYALLDPRDSQVRYVGVTRQPLKRRLHGHIARSTESTSAWVKELRALSLRPSIVPLEVRQTDDRAADAEIKWILYYAKLGNLLNIKRTRICCR